MLDELEELAEGQIVTRGPDGRFTRASLTPDRAREMGKTPRRNRQNEDRVNQLLQQRGINPDSADEGLRSLASIAISGRSGAVSAMRYLDSLTGWSDSQQTGEERPRQFKRGEICPTCGNVAGMFSADTAAKLLEYAKSKRADASESEKP